MSAGPWPFRDAVGGAEVLARLPSATPFLSRQAVGGHGVVEGMKPNPSAEPVPVI